LSGFYFQSIRAADTAVFHCSLFIFHDSLSPSYILHAQKPLKSSNYADFSAYFDHPPQGGYRNSSLLTPHSKLAPSSLRLPPS